MWRRILISGLVLIPIGVIWGIAVLPAYMTGLHQRNVTDSLARWKTEYSDISSPHDAVRTAEMLRYAQSYYVPSDGYRSTPEIEAALQSQRHDTIASFVAALQQYTNEDFGTDSAKWLAHLKPKAWPGANRDTPVWRQEIYGFDSQIE